MTTKKELLEPNPTRLTSRKSHAHSSQNEQNKNPSKEDFQIFSPNSISKMGEVNNEFTFQILIHFE